jgi:type II secretory pathway component GspD/PulD (secretin)
VAFEARNKPWPATLEWLSDLAGLPLLSSGSMPAGTFSFHPPAPDRRYTFGEVLDLVNEGLLLQKFLLLRRDNALLLVRAEEKLDPSLVPRVPLEQLDARGKTEIVSVMIGLRHSRAEDLAPQVKRMLSPFGDVVAWGNQLVVCDTVANLRTLRDTIRTIDEAQEGRPAPPEAPVLRTYPVPGGNAEAVAKILQDIYRDAAKVRISPVGHTMIAVWAGPEDQVEMSRHLRSAPGNAVTELIPLNTLEAGRVTNTLKAMFGDPRTGGPYLEADLERNALIVRGSPEQVQEIRSVLHTLGETPEKVGSVHTFTLERGSATVLAESLQRLLTQMRSNPVKVVVPGEQPSKGEAGKSKGEAGKRPGKPDVPVTLTPSGNRLTVTSDDPEALALVAELLRLVQAPPGEGDFEVIRLKYAQAAHAARILDEMFNGPAPARGGAPGGAPGPGRPRPERARIIADPVTNSLLIKASPLDLLTIRHLLSKALDVPEAGDGKQKEGK